MAVLLKNLVVRPPQREDLVAISELIALCESGEHSMADSSLEDLLSHWQQPDFHLAEDAWVIVTTKGQIVGLASIWHEDQTRIVTSLCVHPEYRQRGIGTVLLRLVELRARQHIHQTPGDTRAVLSGLIGRANEGMQRLFEYEGYQAGRQFLRISFVLGEDMGDQLVSSEAQKKRSVDVSLEQGWLLNAPLFSDRDGLCTVCLYRVYEKELRPAASVEETELETLGALAGTC